MSCPIPLLRIVAQSAYKYVRDSPLCEYCSANVGFSLMLSLYRDLLNAAIEDGTPEKNAAACHALDAVMELLTRAHGEPDLLRRKQILEALATKGEELDGTIAGTIN